jgi:CheY-like chemotaxis protein
VPARPVHVPTLVHEIVDYADAHAQKHRVRVETEFSADARRVRIDADGFQQILEDLLDHAIHVAPPDSVVEVKIDNPDKASLRIELTHPGTCPMTESRHFEPFVSTRADAPRNLAAVQHLATMRAGSAGVELTPNGERLWVQLPQWQEIAKQEETGEKSGGVRVLVVEDDAAARAEIVQILRSAGFDAKDVANVDEAIQAVNNESFDAVTLDLLLGRRYSTKVLAAIRTGRNKDAAVLVLSATRPGNVTFPYPVQGHLQKPITKRTLLRAMRWSGHPPPDPGPVLVVRREPPDATFLAEAKSRGLILIHVHDLAQALQRLETNDPVVVVVDPVMGVGAKFRDSLQGVPLIFWGDDGVERPEAAGTFKEDTDAATLFDAVEQLISQQDAWGEEAWNQ